MKTLLLFGSTLHMAATLSPLFIAGICSEFWWPLESGCIGGGLWE